MTKESLSQQYSYLEDLFGSWQEVERRCRELENLVDAGLCSLENDLVDKVKETRFCVRRVFYQEKYYFIIMIGESEKQEVKLELFVSKEERPSKIRELAELFLKETFSRYK